MKKWITLCFGLFVSVALVAQSYSADTLRPKCAVLRRFLELYHYHPLEWNDTASERLFDKWLNELDDGKLYFTQSDIAALSIYRTSLGEELTGNSWKFFDLSLQLYRRRLLQTDSIATGLLEKPFECSKPENIQWPSASYALSDKELADRWEKLYKWKILDRVMDDQDSTDHFSATLPAGFSGFESKAREAIRRQHVDRMNELFQSSTYFEHKFGELFLNAICWCYDPHTSYMNLADKNEFETALSPFEYSAGMEVEKNDKGQWVITRLVPGGPAWRSGDIHKDDILIKIKSGTHSEKLLEDLDEKEVLSLLSGPDDDRIVVTLKREDGNEKTITLSKEKLKDAEESESIVKSFVIKDSVKLGYIELPDFYTEPGDDNTPGVNGCANDVAKEIVKLKEDSIKGLILDLRYDGGGSIKEALELAGIFIDEGPICSTKDRTGKVHFLRDPNRGTIYDGPLIVLVNSQSASASEMVSAVLQDYHRALIVGGTTYGKGTAQQIVPLDTTGQASENSHSTDYVKITDRKFYRVDGSTTQWKGVVPDIRLPDFYTEDKYREKGNASALLPDNSRPAMYTMFESLGGIPVASLQQLSIKRVATDSDFINLKRFSDLLSQELKGVTIPLQWPSFFEYMQKQEALLDAIRAKVGSAAQPLPIVNTTFDQARTNFLSKESIDVNNAYIDRVAGDDYIRESCNILQDWIRLQN